MVLVWVPTLFLLHTYVLPWRRSLPFSMSDNLDILPNLAGLYLGLRITFAGFKTIHAFFHKNRDLEWVQQVHSVHHRAKTPVAAGSLEFSIVDSLFSLALPSYVTPVLLGATPAFSAALFFLHVADLIVPHCGYHVPGFDMYAEHDLHHQHDHEFDTTCHS